jgi:tRNA threonylcarbamoyladenosine biosynthesis protein TsaB
MRRVLAFDAALGGCAAAVVVDGVAVAAKQTAATQGHASLLPVLVNEVVAAAGVRVPDLDLIAVTLGPGSFTGLRAGLALAQGLAVAAGVRLVGVSVGEALSEALPRRGGRELWSVTDSRRGRIFLERDDRIISLALDALPTPGGPVAIAGDAAIPVAARLAARDADVMLTDARRPAAWHVALAALHRIARHLPERPLRPIYVDPPEARPPSAGLRPAPAG